jgi:5-hydroxyisourate hydrolase-like protein (transthyretin family)
MRKQNRCHFLSVATAVFAASLSSQIAQAQDFTGRVLEDSSGEPVASAELKIHMAGMRELVADLDTDRGGRFTGSDLPPGDYTIDVLKPNFMTATFPLHIPSAPLQVSLLAS